MKFIVFITALTITLSTYSQNEITLPNTQPYLLGEITNQDLRQGTYKSWFESNYENYQVNNSVTSLLKPKINAYHLILFLGTWCGDSKKEVPRILKILDQVDFNYNQLKIVALDRRKAFYKTSPGGEEFGLNIKKVPTLLFLKDGKEVDRIIETPKRV